MTHARVLIADTDRRFRTQLFSRLLDVEVFSDCVSTANDAVEYLRDRHYGLVLIDLGLPNGEAYAVIDELRLAPRVSRPMVLATATRDLQPSVDPDLVQIIMRKPLRVAEVAEMIRSCIGSFRIVDSVSRVAKRTDSAVELGGGNEHRIGVVS